MNQSVSVSQNIFFTEPFKNRRITGNFPIIPYLIHGKPYQRIWPVEQVEEIYQGVGQCVSLFIMNQFVQKHVAQALIKVLGSVRHIIDQTRRKIDGRAEDTGHYR